MPTTDKDKEKVKIDRKVVYSPPPTSRAEAAERTARVKQATS